METRTIEVDGKTYKVMQENEILKLNWKSNKVPDISSAEETNGLHFLSIN